MDEYGQLSGQVVSKAKNSVLFGKTIIRRQELLELMEIKQGVMPFTHLGAPYF